MDIYTASTLQVCTISPQDVWHGSDPVQMLARGRRDGLTHKGALQVQWHGVLGNHDYGELWLENQTGIPQPSNCPNTYRDTECSYGPLAQVPRLTTCLSVHFLGCLQSQATDHAKAKGSQQAQRHCPMSYMQLQAWCAAQLHCSFAFAKDVSRSVEAEEHDQQLAPSGAELVHHPGSAGSAPGRQGLECTAKLQSILSIQRDCRRQLVPLTLKWCIMLVQPDQRLAGTLWSAPQHFSLSWSYKVVAGLTAGASNAEPMRHDCCSWISAWRTGTGDGIWRGPTCCPWRMAMWNYSSLIPAPLWRTIRPQSGLSMKVSCMTPSRRGCLACICCCN